MSLLLRWSETVGNTATLALLLYINTKHRGVIRRTGPSTPRLLSPLACAHNLRLLSRIRTPEMRGKGVYISTTRRSPTGPKIG